MDLKSKMYVCYGTSLRSEKDAYNNAVKNSLKSVTTS